MGEAVAEVGQTANNYQILARLATGGMAEIFLARGVSATGVERYCVLKRILRNRASDVSFVRMFLDEAKLAAQLQHPNVAQVYDIGKLGDSYFFTMEYVHGETVRAIMQRARSLRRDLPLQSVLTIVAGAAAGLHHAHDRIGIDGRPLNIVHRDVSPSNLMVSYEGSVKVVDFGVAKASDRANETRSGTVKGKISYLSPEQARGSSSIDRRSDLFALGIVMWELLAGERLYKRASDFENMSAIVNEPPQAPSTRKPGIPPELDEITLRLLAKDANARFQTADEVIEALEAFASRNATMISSSALARFLRDMFGQRPEPWVEIDTVEVPEGVTVTSEPIPSELAIPVGADDDISLERVPKLDLERPHDVDQLPTLRQPAADVMSTLNDASPPPPARPAPAPSRPPPVAPGTQTIAGIGSGAHPRIPASGPQAFVAAPGSGSHREPSASAAAAYPRALTGDRLPDDEEPASKGAGWQLVAVIAIAAIVGSMTMWFVMKGRGDEAAAPDAAVVAMTAPAVVEPTALVEPTAPAVGEPTVPIDGTEAVAVAEVDAAAPVATIEVDAAAALEVDAAAAAPVQEPPPRPVEKKPDPPKPKKSAIETAWEAGNFRDIVSRCTKAFPANTDELRCVLAACKVKSESKARTFLTRIDKGKRKALVAACKNNDVDLEDKPREPEKDCERDPMSCQH